MKRFRTHTRFVPLKYVDGSLEHFKLKNGKSKDFKTRKAVVKFCDENDCLYCEEKYIFYK